MLRKEYLRVVHSDVGEVLKIGDRYDACIHPVLSPLMLVPRPNITH